MQIQRINPYTYGTSTNKVRQSDAKNPNFGLRLVTDAIFTEELERIVGGFRTAEIIRVVDRMNEEKNLIAGFQRVFRESERLTFCRSKPGVQRSLDPDTGDINPLTQISGWNNLKVGLKLTKKGEEIRIECVDAQGQRGLKQVNKDSVSIVRAIQDGLLKAFDMYAERKIAQSFNAKLAELPN